MAAVTAYADSFVAVAEKYTPSDGALAEQFHRDTGAPLSAVDLTWSYASFVTMAQRRAGQYPKSWGTRNIDALPATCSGSSEPGVYVPALAAGAPSGTTTCTVLVLFEVNATTYYGENVYVVGNVTDLGEWSIDNSMPLNPSNYSSERPLWYASVYLPAGQQVSYSYAREENCGQPHIYETVNRTLTVPPCGGSSVSIDDAWVGPAGAAGSC